MYEKKIYKKAPYEIDYEKLLAESRKRLTEAEKKSNKEKIFWEGLLVKRVTKIVSAFFIIAGVGILLYSSFPYISYFFHKISPWAKAKEVVSFGYDPAALSLQSRYSYQYFSNVDKNISVIREELKNQPADYSNVQGEFYLSIPKLGFNRLPVKLNVDSYDRNVYEKVLEKYLAHFKGSSIPGKRGTTFVYGHSSAEWYANAHPNYVGIAFTRLPALSLGDDISVEYEGQLYEYTVVKIKEVDPYDLSPVFQNDGRKLLALMTCVPVGIGTDRLIVIAEQI